MRSTAFLAVLRISIHPPREGWDSATMNTHDHHRISIHPPREGWDGQKMVKAGYKFTISIHPPREGWDSRSNPYFSIPLYFNPPTP